MEALLCWMGELADENNMAKSMRFPPSEIHIHILRLDEAYLLNPAECLLPLLPLGENERYKEFELEEKRNEFLWSRLLLYGILASYLDEEMKDLNFCCDKNGKPFLKDSEIQFNFSHTKGLVVCAVCRRNIGIDVENMAYGKKEGRDLNSLAKRFFSTDEKKYLFSKPLDDQTKTFYHIFTMKEAVLKAIGSGLNHSLTYFSVPLPLAEKSATVEWEYFTKILEPGEFSLATAVKNMGTPTRYRMVEWTKVSIGKHLTINSKIFSEGTYGRLYR